MLQPDAGSAIIFIALIIPLYREGFPTIYLIIGISVAIFYPNLISRKNTIACWLLIITAIIISFSYKNKKRIGFILLLFLAIVVSFILLATDYLLNEVLKPYQKSRIEAIFRPELVDPQAEGWNLEQSKIAIGSGGFAGKGFLQGTQTKFGYVPEQSTDFIFSTLAEEHGWLGCAD